MVSRLIEIADAGRTVLVPSIELAAALFDALERAQIASGREVWATARVRDFGGWLREQHVQRQFTDSSAARCLSDAEELELWRRIVQDSESAEHFLEPSGAVRAARRARRAIAEHGIPLPAVEAYGTEETLVFCDWNAEFTERCRVLHCQSADELLASLGRERGAQPSTESIAWIESPGWRPVARRWLERHAGPPLAPAAALKAGASRWLQVGSAAAELAGMADWAAEQLRANPGFRAWMCVPDLAQRREEVVDAFDAVLAPQRFALQSAPTESAVYAVAGGTALADHPSVRAALRFLSANFGPVPFEEFSALLRSAELQAEAQEASLAARLDLALRPRAPSEADFPEWLALAQRVASATALGNIPALERLRSAAGILNALSGRHPMSRWVAVWSGALEAGPWSQRRRWSSGEYQSAERFRELLAALATGDVVFGTQPHRGAEEILRRAARDTAFQIETGIPSISVSGQLMDPWLAYDGLWIARCDETHWPPPPDPVPLIPVRLQRQYGVIAAGERSQLEHAEDLQRRWESRAEQRVWSGADAGEGRSAAPSPLLRRMVSDAPPGAGVSANGASPDARPPSGPAPRPHWLAQFRAAPVLEPFVDEWAPPFGAGERTRGVATLRAQSRCAFRGFAETRLAAGTLERPIPGFNDSERGELLHDALKRVWAEVLDSVRLSSLGEDARTQLLDESARDAIAELCRRRDPGARWRERERARLVALLDRWLKVEEQRAAFEVLRIEGQDPRVADAALDESEPTMRLAGLEFRIRIDRIDRLEDGGRVVIDYKSGQAARDWVGERPDNPQLPVYALRAPESLVAVAYGRINASDCRFVAETERGDVFRKGERRSRMEGAASLAELARRWSARIEKLAQEFAQGRAVLDPTEHACSSCRFQGVCRVASLQVALADD